MKFANWTTFITNHPDRNNLSKITDKICNLIDPRNHPIENTLAIQSTKSTVIITLDPFNHNPSPHFYHHQIGIPLPGEPTRLLALQGFTNKATPIELDTRTLFAQTTNDITTPTLSSFLSFHDKDVTTLKSIKTDPTSKHKIRKAAVLTPELAVLLIASHTKCPWTLLFQAITMIKDKDPDTTPTNLDYAQPFFPLLLTLWSFTRNTPETIAITHTARTIATDNDSTTWCNNTHDTHIQHTIPETTQTTPSQLADGINRLAKTIEDQQNDKFATADEEKGNDDNDIKAWKKLDPTFKKIIQFAGTTDGETPAQEPTPRLVALLKSRNGPIATCLFTQWHTPDMVVQTGMATNITKGCLVSYDGPFSINTFSPFFTPPRRAGFSIITHDELNSIALLSESKNLSHNDIQKLVKSEPYIPTEPHIFISQIKNYHNVICDILGENSLTAKITSEVITIFRKNELLYYNIFNGDKDFAVWFLNQLHFKVQQIFHHCASAESVADVPFHQFNMNTELTGVTTLTYMARQPKWYSDIIQKRDEESAKQTQSQHRNNHNNKRSYGSTHPQRAYNNNNDRAQMRTMENKSPDLQTKVQGNEHFSYLVKYKNQLSCKQAKVSENGVQICNSWHI